MCIHTPAPSIFVLGGLPLDVERNKRRAPAESWYLSAHSAKHVYVISVLIVVLFG